MQLSWLKQLSKGHRWTLTAGPEGYSLHAVLSKGDWKYKREWLDQHRNCGNVGARHGVRPSEARGHGRICPRCLADGGVLRPWADIKKKFFNQPDMDEALTSSARPDTSDVC